MHGKRQWSDKPDVGHLHIVREEIRDQTENRFEVVEHTKTNQDRFAILVPKAIETLKRIERQGEYMFMRDRKKNHR